MQRMQMQQDPNHWPNHSFSTSGDSVSRQASTCCSCCGRNLRRDTSLSIITLPSAFLVSVTCTRLSQRPSTEDGEVGEVTDVGLEGLEDGDVGAAA